jgi:hypothetical protein
MKLFTKLIPACLSCLIILLSANLSAQTTQDLGSIHGNFQFNSQYYRTDSLIGAPEVPEKMLMNGFANFNYTRGSLRAGLRYESYLPPLLGYPAGYNGSGFPYKYIAYEYNGLDVTVGNFYEQFGSGMIFRSYEERTLGIDNAMDGVRLKYSPAPWLNLKAVYGRQRLFFELGEGIVRGIDGEISVNQLIDSLVPGNLIIGGSMVSKYQADNDPVLKLPENVASYAGRFAYYLNNFNLTGEYVYKDNDPSGDNGLIYKNGQALLLNAGYAKKGIGITVGFKSVDNMSYRSDRDQNTINLLINYLPALNKQHTYNLASTLYPYATQPNGEFAYSGEIFYQVKKGSLLGGKYGTNLALNYSEVLAPGRTYLNPEDDIELNGYKESLFSPGKEVYYRDINVGVKRKLNKKIKLTATYINLNYNNDISLGVTESNPVFKLKDNITAHIAVLDISQKLKSKHSLRYEIQHLYTKDHRENWATLLIEYTFSPHWFIAALDQYNYGNPLSKEKLHYYYGSVGYIKGGNRFSVSYGRQRAGVFCVGGVCRLVPASNGLAISITSTF